MEVPDVYRSVAAAARIALVGENFARIVGRPLVAETGDPVSDLWQAEAVIVAHGTEPDPLFFFANRRALEVFESDLAGFIGMPSRFSAEAPVREARQALLDRVSARGFIDDYSGIRVSATGRRFRIERAIVWNLIGKDGERLGQAATFML